MTTENETDTTPQNSEELENFFAEDLAHDRARLRGDTDWLDAARRTQEDDRQEEIEEQEEQEQKDIFDTPKKKRQKNWLSNRIQVDPETMKQKKRGRPKGSKNRYQTVRRSHQEAIQVMSASGVSKSVIAKLLCMTPDQLRNRFSHELDYGSEILTVRIVNAMVQKALDGNVSAGIFYLKAKAGWKELDRTDVPDDKHNLSEIERNQRLMALFLANPQLVEAMKQKRLAAAPIDVTSIEKPEAEPENDQGIFDV